MRRAAPILLIALLALGACSSGKGSSTAASSGASSGSTSTTVAVSTLPASDVDAVEVQGAKAFATIYVDSLRKSDPTITPQQTACLPDSLVASVGAHHLLELANLPVDKLTAADLAAVREAFTACGISEQKVLELFAVSSSS